MLHGIRYLQSQLPSSVLAHQWSTQPADATGACHCACGPRTAPFRCPSDIVKTRFSLTMTDGLSASSPNTCPHPNLILTLTLTLTLEERSALPPQDLTLPEIRTLRARQRLYFRDQSYNDKFKVRRNFSSSFWKTFVYWSPGAPGCGTTNLTLLQCSAEPAGDIRLGVCKSPA